MWNCHLGKWKAVRNADNHTGGGDGDLLTEKQRKANEEYRRTWIFEKFEGAYVTHQLNLDTVVDADW